MLEHSVSQWNNTEIHCSEEGSRQNDSGHCFSQMNWKDKLPTLCLFSFCERRCKKCSKIKNKTRNSSTQPQNQQVFSQVIRTKMGDTFFSCVYFHDCCKNWNKSQCTHNHLRQFNTMTLNFSFLSQEIECFFFDKPGQVFLTSFNKHITKISQSAPSLLLPSHENSKSTAGGVICNSRRKVLPQLLQEAGAKLEEDTDLLPSGTWPLS